MKDSPELRLLQQALYFKDELHKNFYITPRKALGKCLGRDLEKQGNLIRKMVSQNPESFPYLNNEENLAEYSKDMIIFVQRVADRLVSKASLLTSNTGGYLIPAAVQPELALLARNYSYALRYATIWPMSENIRSVPTEFAKCEVAWIEEEGEITAQNPTFGQALLQTRDTVTLTAKKIAALVTLSNELLRDNSVDIVSVLTEAFLDAMGQELDNQMLNGDGAMVSGILTAAAGHSIVLSGTSFSTVTSTDISSVISKIEQGYLKDSRFVVGRMPAHYLRNIKDEQSRPIFIDGRAGEPGIGDCYGFNSEVSEKISSTDGTGQAFGAFGNLKKFFLGRRNGDIPVGADPITLFNKNQTRFRFVSRWGFAYADRNAFCRIING